VTNAIDDLHCDPELH